MHLMSGMSKTKPFQLEVSSWSRHLPISLWIVAKFSETKLTRIVPLMFLVAHLPQTYPSQIPSLNQTQLRKIPYHSCTRTLKCILVSSLTTQHH